MGAGIGLAVSTTGAGLTCSGSAAAPAVLFFSAETSASSGARRAGCWTSITKRSGSDKNSFVFAQPLHIEHDPDNAVAVLTNSHLAHHSILHWNRLERIHGETRANNVDVNSMG
jgi:hypothetical protein